jgi:hypothetical protein
MVLMLDIEAELDGGLVSCRGNEHSLFREGEMREVEESAEGKVPRGVEAGDAGSQGGDHCVGISHAKRSMEGHRPQRTRVHHDLHDRLPCCTAHELQAVFEWVPANGEAAPSRCGGGRGTELRADDVFEECKEGGLGSG